MEGMQLATQDVLHLSGQGSRGLAADANDEAAGLQLSRRGHWGVGHAVLRFGGGHAATGSLIYDLLIGEPDPAGAVSGTGARWQRKASGTGKPTGSAAGADRPRWLRCGGRGRRNSA